MDPAALAALIAELLAAIHMMAAYPGGQPPPGVHVVSEAEIQQRLCAGRPCRVKAFYHPEWGIFVVDTLDVRHNAFDRSILVHELVHHLQRITGRFDGVPGHCARRNAQELEAYDIQNRYLAAQHSLQRAFATGVIGHCKGD